MPVARTASGRAGAIAEVMLCSSVPTQWLIGALATQAGVPAQTPSGELTLPFVLWVTLGDTVLLVGIMAALTWLHGETLRDLWLGRRPLAREALLGLALIPLVVLGMGVLLGIILRYLPWLYTVPTNPLEALATGGAGDAALFGVVAVVAGGVREELQRAFLLRRFERHLGGATVGVVVLSTAFGLGHLMQGWHAVVATGALGAFWAVVYLRRRSCVAPIVSHAGFNGLEVLRVAVLGGA